MKTAKAEPTPAENRRRIRAKLDRIGARLERFELDVAAGRIDKPKARRELDRLHSRVAAISEEIENAR